MWARETECVKKSNKARQWHVRARTVTCSNREQGFVPHSVIFFWDHCFYAYKTFSKVRGNPRLGLMLISLSLFHSWDLVRTPGVVFCVSFFKILKWYWYVTGPFLPPVRAKEQAPTIENHRRTTLEEPGMAGSSLSLILKTWLKVGLGICRTNANSQWIPVYKAFYSICLAIRR